MLRQLPVLLAVVLAGCAESARDQFVSNCDEGGGTRESCECVYDYADQSGKLDLLEAYDKGDLVQSTPEVAKLLLGALRRCDFGES